MSEGNSDSSFQFTDTSVLVVRNALPEDSLDILNWRNDPHVCAMSRHTEPIDESAHHTWYSKAVNDPERLMIIGLLAGRKIGIVRFDRRQESQWEVSIALSPDVRGRGVGRCLLGMALERLHEAQTCVDVLAVARLSNEPSVKLFLALGFKQESDDGELVRLLLYADRTQ